MSILCARSRRFPKVFPSLSLFRTLDTLRPPFERAIGAWSIPLMTHARAKRSPPSFARSFRYFSFRLRLKIFRIDACSIEGYTRHLENNYLSRSSPFRLSRIISRTFTIRLIYSPAMLSSKIKVSQSSEMWKEENLRISLSIPKKRKKERRKEAMIDNRKRANGRGEEKRKWSIAISFPLIQKFQFDRHPTVSDLISVRIIEIRFYANPLRKLINFRSNITTDFFDCRIEINPSAVHPCDTFGRGGD